jgi:hypothetical protein
MKRPVTIRSGEKLEAFESQMESTFLTRLNKLVATCQAVLNCSSFKISENNLTVRGTGATAAGSIATPFAITEIGHRDFFVARQLSNFRAVATVPTFDVGAADILIAKPVLARRSVSSDKIDGSTITYTNKPAASVDNRRLAHDGVNDEDQAMYPRYITLADLGFTATVRANAQCVIYATQTDSLAGVLDDDGNALDWLEQTTRVWAKYFV